MIPSASQTLGPFFNFGLTTNTALGGMAGEGVEGERIRLVFRVTDGDGRALPGDAMIELWQADASGRYRHPLDPRGGEADAAFMGFGRLEVDANGECVFETVKPGRVGEQAPHVNVTLFARGLGKALRTRVYFAHEAANAQDEVLAMVPEERRGTLLARQVVAGTWLMDIRLQGEGETVFFDM